MTFPRRSDNDFQAEIESHIAIETDRLIAEGVPPGEARDRARRAFGNATRAQERFHESQRWVWLEQFMQDIRYGLRSMRKAPVFTITAALTIALGVGANTAIFSLMDAVLLRMLPVQSPKELYFPGATGTRGQMSAPPYPCLERFRAEVSSFTGLTAFMTDEMRIEIDGRPEQVMSEVASGNHYEVLGVKPFIGRLFVPQDEALNPPVVVINHRYWLRRFGGDPNVLGKTLVEGKRTFTIVGVTPPGFHGMEPARPADVTFPLTITRNMMNDPSTWAYNAIARLKPGATVERATAEANAVFKSFMADSTSPPEMIREHFDHMQLNSAAHGMNLRQRFSKPLQALMGIVVLVLLIATANIANLLLARGTSRAREYAIRLATGAGRGRLVRQLLTETLLLFTGGAALGMGFAYWGVSGIQGLLAQGRRPIAIDAQVNWRVLAFTFAITLAAGVVAGLMPALRALMTDPQHAMQDGRSSESRGSGLFGHTLVAGQVALSLVLLVTAALFVGSLRNLRDVDLGFRPAQILTVSLLPQTGTVRGDRFDAYWSRVLDEVRRIPGARAAALSNYTPLSGRDRGSVVKVQGYEPRTFDDSIIRLNHVTEDYFETYGIQLLAGRLLTDGDAESTAKVALINETAARDYFARRDPIGQILQMPHTVGSGGNYRIVGVVRDIKHNDVRQAAPRFAFIPLRQPKDPIGRLTLSVASRLSTGQTLDAVRRAIDTVNPQTLISDVITAQDQVDDTLLTERLLSSLSAVFGVLALILASIGLYGVLSYRIGQQRKSIGIRMALGASPSGVASSVLRQTGFVLAAGLAVGLPFSIFAARAADSMLWGIQSSQASPYLVAAALLLAIGLVSAAIPVRRASTINPINVLRHD